MTDYHLLLEDLAEQSGYAVTTILTMYKDLLVQEIVNGRMMYHPDTLKALKKEKAINNWRCTACGRLRRPVDKFFRENPDLEYGYEPVCKECQKIMDFTKKSNVKTEKPMIGVNLENPVLFRMDDLEESVTTVMQTTNTILQNLNEDVKKIKTVGDDVDITVDGLYNHIESVLSPLSKDISDLVTRVEKIEKGLSIVIAIIKSDSFQTTTRDVPGNLQQLFEPAVRV